MSFISVIHQREHHAKNLAHRIEMTEVGLADGTITGNARERALHKIARWKTTLPGLQAEIVSLQKVIGIVDMMGMIDMLRSAEGDSVTVLCDNPDGPPNNAILCNGEWTNYIDRRFEGSTLHECLTKATAAYNDTQTVLEVAADAAAGPITY